jgi:nicotinate-nucleotide pyrophosphorylase
MDKNRAFLLPFGIDLRVEDGIASIESNLPEALASSGDPMENGRIVGVVEGVEQLLLSLARVGLNLSNPQVAQAIHNCVANLQSS